MYCTVYACFVNLQNLSISRIVVLPLLIAHSKTGQSHPPNMAEAHTRSKSASRSVSEDLEEGLMPLPSEAPKLHSTRSEPAYPSQPLNRSFDSNPKSRSKSTSELSLPVQQQKKSFSLWETALSFPNSLSLTRQPSVPVFYCTICLENHPQSNSFQSASCHQAHCYCQETMVAFIDSCVNDGVISIRCPGYGECSGILSNEEIERLVPLVTYQKYIRFKAIKENPHFRECPFCNHAVIGNEATPEIVCESCQGKFCYFHANAHPNLPCQSYTREQLQSQIRSLAVIQTTTRNCPECHVATEKNGGCNHMTCHQCRTVCLSFSIFFYHPSPLFRT
jgi:hypothetical protein